MKIEDIILTCIKEKPGISAKKIVSCLDSFTEEDSSISIFKQLRTLRRNGNIHNRGDRWYVMNRNK